MNPADWDLPQVYCIELTADRAAIDAYGHVNNAVYLQWLDLAAWNHSAALGVPLNLCLTLDRGMAVVRTVVRYAQPAYLGDALSCGTWIVRTDGKLRVTRRFQMRKVSDGATLLRAEVEYVCLRLSTGKPARFPPEFLGSYVAPPDLAQRFAQLAAL
jgi:acyl-CoA thioester hydrolase